MKRYIFAIEVFYRTSNSFFIIITIILLDYILEKENQLRNTVGLNLEKKLLSFLLDKKRLWVMKGERSQQKQTSDHRLIKNIPAS